MHFRITKFPVACLAAVVAMAAQPASAGDGTLTINGKTIAVQSVSGGEIDAGDPDGGYGPKVNGINFQIDVNGLPAVMPMINDLLASKSSTTTAQLTVDNETWNLTGVRMDTFQTPDCGAEILGAPLFDVTLVVDAIKPAAAPPAVRVPEPQMVTGCTISVSGGPRTPDSMIYPAMFTSGISSDAAIGEMRDYDQEPAAPFIGGLAFDGKGMNQWARDVIAKGETASLGMKVTYLVEAKPVLIITYTGLVPTRASLLSTETDLTPAGATITLP